MEIKRFSFSVLIVLKMCRVQSQKNKTEMFMLSLNVIIVFILLFSLQKNINCLDSVEIYNVEGKIFNLYFNLLNNFY